MWKDLYFKLGPEKIHILSPIILIIGIQIQHLYKFHYTVVTLLVTASRAPRTLNLLRPDAARMKMRFKPYKYPKNG